VFQVWARANGKGTLIDRSGGLTGKAEQLHQQVLHIVRTRGYTRPAVITFEALKSLFEVETGHFYGARGTNRYEGCDCLIVAGTPQPDLETITKTARMLFDSRMLPFNAEWSERDQVYATGNPEGQRYSYPVSGFWHDADLQALLWQYREAEIIQAAHRVRPVLYGVDIWLLTNLPIDDLPPSALLTIANVFDAPPNVDAYRWPEIIAFAEVQERETGYVTTADLVREFEISKTTADKYISLIAEHFDWPTFQATGRGRGRPPRAAGRHNRPIPDSGNKSSDVIIY
jgi:hypothetical protein